MTDFNNPFGEALKDFKPSKKEEQEKAKVPEVKEQPKAKIPESEPFIDKPKLTTISENKPEQPWRHPETGLLKEDQENFEALCKLIGLKKWGRDGKRYWRVRDCFRDSHDLDISLEVKRWLDLEMSVFSVHDLDHEQRNAAFDKADKVRKIIEPLLKRGHEASAVRWLLSRTPEKMKYGNGSRELRLQEAKASAQKAGKTIEEIAKAHGLKNLLL